MTTVAFLLGGTGFIGSAVLEKLLLGGRTVLTTTRSFDRDAFLNLLARRGMDLEMVQHCLDCGQLRVAYKFDLGASSLGQADSWHRVLAEAGVRQEEIGVVINLVTDSSASNRGIFEVNLSRTANLVQFIKTIRVAGCADLIFISMGSVAEKANVLRSPYGSAKRKMRELVAREQVSDFHVIAGLVKGRGDYNLPKAANDLVRTMSGFPLWHDGFKLSVIAVEDLAGIILHLESSSELLKAQARDAQGRIALPIEVNVSGGELTFKELLENLVDGDRAKQLEGPSVLPFALEALYLVGYWIVYRAFMSSDQVRVRLANFALLGALARWPSLQRRINHHLTVGTAAEIRGLLDLPDSVKITLDPELLCVLRGEPSRLFILRLRAVEELKAIVRQGRLPKVVAATITPDVISAEACEMTSTVR